LATRGIKYWGLGGSPSTSLAGKVHSVDRFAAPKSPTFHTANVGSHFRILQIRFLIQIKRFMKLNIQKRGNSIFKWVVIISFVLGISTFIFFYFSSHILLRQIIEQDKIWRDKYEKMDNLDIYCRNSSNLAKNPSLKLIIDDSMYVKAKRLTGTEISKSVRMNAGKHIIQVSTINNKYLVTDTIQIDTFGGYFLDIDFNIDTIDLKKQILNKTFKIIFGEKIVL
jgi:hypothetical protein